MRLSRLTIEVQREIKVYPKALGVCRAVSGVHSAFDVFRSDRHFVEPDAVDSDGPLRAAASRPVLAPPGRGRALTVYLGIWALINYAAADPGQTDLPFGSLFEFTTEKVSEPVSEFTAVRSGGRMKYKFIPRAGSPGVDYRSDDAERKVWMGEREADVQAPLVKQGDREVKFTPDTAHQRYVEEGGKRYLEQDQRSFGRIIAPRGGGFFVRFLLNVLHLAAWFVVLWLLLGFQWSHALGMAIAIWLAMTYVAPYILRARGRGESTAGQGCGAASG